MDKKGRVKKLFSKIVNGWKSFKTTYLFKLVSRFLSVVCSIILVILLVIGAMMFYFNMKIKAYEKKGLEFTAPFGLYTIISGSMEPNVEIYDVVIAVDEDINKIKVGDIITFISTWEINYGMTVTHRVVGISKTSTGEIQLSTKGDNNQTADGGIVTQSNLIGKVVGRLPQVGRLQFFLATKAGWFFVVFIPAVIIIIVDSMKIFKLYILKNQINEVKTPKEAHKEKFKKEIEKKPEQMKLKIDDILDKPKDENVDTVELPKVGEDGIIKENTSELPALEDTEYHSGKTEIISIVSADLGDKVTEDAPKINAEKEGKKIKIDDIGLPVLNKEKDKTQNNSKLPKRKELKHRDPSA